MLVWWTTIIPSQREHTKSSLLSLHRKFAQHGYNRLRGTSHRRRTLRSRPRYCHAAPTSATRSTRSQACVPLVMKRVHEVYIEYAFDLRVENGEPVTTFFFELGRDAERVELVQKTAVLAYRGERS